MEVSGRCLRALLLLGCSLALSAPGLAAMPVGLQVVLKLDDVRDTPASLRNFPRVLALLQKHDAVACLGVIGDSLAGNGKQAYYDFLRQLQHSGRIEFWNHGYTHARAADKTTEFFNQDLAAQTAALVQTNTLMLQHTGIRLQAFGAPYNSNDGQTEAALLAAGMRVWFFPKAGTQHKMAVLTQRVDMERATGVVDEALLAQNLARAAQSGPIVLQGHPAQWDEDSFAAFERILLLLKAKGYRFMTTAALADSPAPP